MFEWDEIKRLQNIEKHGIDFEQVWTLDWNRALYTPDGRYEYGETRMIAMVPQSGRLHTCIFTLRGNNRRIISLRKSNDREVARYDKKTLDH